jgi:hypothetical protein
MMTFIIMYGNITIAGWPELSSLASFNIVTAESYGGCELGGQLHFIFNCLGCRYCLSIQSLAKIIKSPVF